MTAAHPRLRVAVVIGSGSVKCAAALGLFKVLARESIPIDMVVGCSGGALYAALIAMRQMAIPGMNWTDEIGRQLLADADAALAKAENDPSPH